MIRRASIAVLVAIAAVLAVVLAPIGANAASRTETIRAGDSITLSPRGGCVPVLTGLVVTCPAPSTTTTSGAPATTAPPTSSTSTTTTTTTMPPSGCTRNATGSTLQSQINASSSGQVVCLTGTAAMSGSGLYAKAGVTVRGGTITGLVNIRPGDVNFTLDQVHLVGNGSRVAPLQVNGSGFHLTNSDVTNNHASQSCMTIGGDSATYGRADDAVISGSTIHDCGVDTYHDHGIYLDGTTGYKVTGNTITGNAAYGIQLYVDADDGLINGNTITANGGGIIIAGQPVSGTSQPESDRNLIDSNVIAHSLRLPNVEVYHPGVGNVLSNNCIPPPLSTAGLTVSGTITNC